MNLDDFIKAFADEIEDVQQDKINANTIYKNIDSWDSLAVLSIISLIDDKFEVILTGADLRSCETIENLYNLILSKS